MTVEHGREVDGEGRVGVDVRDEPDADQAPAEEVAPADPPRRRPMKRATKIRLLVILGVALIAAALFTGNWLLNARNYVSTDNAQIDGNQILINAPASGTLIDWRAQLGTVLRADESIGRIEIPGGYVQPQMVVRAPAAGVVAVNSAVEGQFVAAGTQLAVAYDSAGVFVTARVDETDIDKVSLGQAVDVQVDAFPDARLTGRVVEIKTGAAGVFSLFPQSNSTGNFQKVTQVIPVKISIDDLQGLALAPGMSVTARIHRR